MKNQTGLVKSPPIGYKEGPIPVISGAQDNEPDWNI